MNRRRFVGSAALLALGPAAATLLSGCSPKSNEANAPPLELSDHEKQTLFAVSRALFPHADAPDQPYLAVVATLDETASKDPDTKALLTRAVSDLDSAAGGDWLAASPEQKVAILEDKQVEAYFGLVLNTAIDTVYRHPAIWALVGYGGSSLEHGGYIDAGFDDIDWLPTASSEAGT